MANLKLNFDEYIPLRDIVFKTLREAIITGELKPGERLMEIKLANELLGAYDQVSESGKQLRKALIPFYSWMEVNAKRYVQLFKNGLTEDDFFTAKLPQIAAAQIPGLTYKLAKTWFLLNFFSLLVSAFNHLFFPKDEEELPPEIQAKQAISATSYK